MRAAIDTLIKSGKYLIFCNDICCFILCTRPNCKDIGLITKNTAKVRVVALQYSVVSRHSSNTTRKT